MVSVVNRGCIIGGGSTLTLASLEIASEPTTTSYKVGDTFNTDGLSLIARYAEGYMLDVTEMAIPSIPIGYEFTEDDVNITSVTLTYSESGKQVTASYAIEVVAFDLTSNPIYDAGTYNYQDITGKFLANLSYGTGDSTLDGSYVQVTTKSASSTHTLWFDYAFDLTDISYIKATAKCQSYAGLNISQTNQKVYSSSIAKWATANGSTVTQQTYGNRWSSLTNVNFVLDVRDLSGEYYIRAGCNYNYLNGIMQVSKLWLE